MTPAIRFENVSKKFTLQTSSQKSIQELLISLFRQPFQSRRTEEIWSLKNLSFDIERGCTTGIVGANGAGKSTILKLVTGILKPTTGTITVDGRVAAMLELGTGFHPDLTGRENLFLYGAMFGLSRQEMEYKVPQIIEFSELGRFIDVPVKNYSSGMYVRLGFAAAIQVEADILLLDEVLVVGDYAFQQKCWEKINEFRTSNKTIVLISHDLRVVQDLCDQALLIEQGQLTTAGDVNQVVQTYYHHLGNMSKLKLDEPLNQMDGTPSNYSTVQITGVELLNDKGKKIETLEGDSPVTVRINYQADTDVKDALFGVQIWGEFRERTGNHIVCHDTNTARHEFLPVEINGAGTVEIQYAALPLSSGNYFLRAAIFPPEPDREPYATSFRVCEFEVKRTHKDGLGLVSIPHQWNIINKTDDP